MTIEIEEVTVKDGIVRITALNCSEENLQKLERLRDDCYQKELQFVFDTRNNKSDCIYLTYWLHHQKVTAGCKRTVKHSTESEVLLPPYQGST